MLITKPLDSKHFNTDTVPENQGLSSAAKNVFSKLSN